MKNIKTLFISLSVFLYACQKEPVEIFPPGPQTYGFMQAIKKVGGSRANWAGGGKASIDNNDPVLFGMSCHTADEYGQIRDRLSIYQIPLHPGKGTYAIQEGNHVSSLPSSGYSRSISDGDVAGAYYYVKKNSNSWVEILELDTVAKMVKGRFEIHYEVAPNHADRGFPKEVSFENGYFEMEIRE